MKKILIIAFLLMAANSLFSQQSINDFLTRNSYMQSRNCNSEISTIEYKLNSINDKTEVFLCKATTNDSKKWVLKLCHKFEMPTSYEGLSKKEREKTENLYKRLKKERKYSDCYFFSEKDITDILAFITRNKAYSSKPLSKDAYCETNTLTINNRINIKAERKENSTKWYISRNYMSLSSNHIYQGDVEPIEDMFNEAIAKMKIYK